MTATLTTTNLVSRYGDPTCDRGGAQIRSHFRHLAMVVTVKGLIDAANIDRVVAHMRHLILAKERLVIDLSNANCVVAEILSLLRSFSEDCSAGDVDWVLVADPSVRHQLRDFDDEATFAIADSVPEALHSFAEEIDERRELLLPLVKKTA